MVNGQPRPQPARPKLSRIDYGADYGAFNDAARGRVDPERIERNWEDVLRIVGSLHTGAVWAYYVIRMFSRDGRPTVLGDAIAHYGRIDRLRADGFDVREQDVARLSTIVRHHAKCSAGTASCCRRCRVGCGRCVLRAGPRCKTTPSGSGRTGADTDPVVERGARWLVPRGCRRSPPGCSTCPRPKMRNSSRRRAGRCSPRERRWARRAWSLRSLVRLIAGYVRALTPQMRLLLIEPPAPPDRIVRVRSDWSLSRALNASRGRAPLPCCQAASRAFW
nr:transposase [Streptomyces mediolani]